MNRSSPLLRTAASAPMAVLVLGMMSGCSSLQSANSPDVVYAEDAEAARALQVPPDLTDISNTEQFVLPGTSGGPVSRNTLLPEFSTVRFERAGQQSWLSIDSAAEELWPQLLAFVKKEKYRIERTEPTAGLIVTQWQALSDAGRGSLLRNLIGDDEAWSRIAFRLERRGSGTRLFARSQAASAEQVEGDAESGDTIDADGIAWPAASHDPEATSALLSRFLVFLGVNEQKAQGIISEEQARLVLDEALLVSTGSGQQLVIQRGFKPAWQSIVSALDALDLDVTSSDDGVGRIEFLDGETPMVFEIKPQHVSEVRVELSDPSGRRLPGDAEKQLLESVLAQIV